MAALGAFHAHKIPILTPYTDTVNVAIVDVFASRGIDILTIKGFGLDDDIQITELPVAAIVEAACKCPGRGR